MRDGCPRPGRGSPLLRARGQNSPLPVSVGSIGRSRSITPAIQQQRDRRTFRALRVREFRRYFFAQLYSISGNNAQTVALGWWVLQLTDSGRALGLVAAAEFLPILFLSPLVGSLVDRFDKRRLLLGTQTFAMMIAVLLAVLSATGRGTVLGIGMLALFLGVSNAVDYPSRQTFVRDMVGVGTGRNDSFRHGVALPQAISSPAVDTG